MQRALKNTILNALLVLILGGMTVMAQTTGAMLYALGNTTLNGAVVGSSTVVFSGDRLQTTDSSVASITQSGSSIVVNSNSSVQYENSQVEVLNGTARVSTLAGLSTRVGQLTISPVEKAAKYEIIKHDGNLFIASREGTLTVSDGSRNYAVQPGGNTMLALGSAGWQPSAQKEPAPVAAAMVAASATESQSLYTGQADDAGLNFCPNVNSCRRPNVSRIRPCKCVFYPPF